jgi:hypothetical protein
VTGAEGIIKKGTKLDRKGSKKFITRAVRSRKRFDFREVSQSVITQAKARGKR